MNIRQCTNFEDYAACIELQRAVWGFDDLDITPLRSFVIARRGGGFTLGAFDKDEQLVGFAHALPAFDDAQQPYYYSQMLAVLPRPATKELARASSSPSVITPSREGFR